MCRTYLVPLHPDLPPLLELCATESPTRTTEKAFMKKRTMYVSITANSIDDRTQHASTQYAAGRKKRREGEKEGEREKEGSKAEKDTELR